MENSMEVIVSKEQKQANIIIVVVCLIFSIMMGDEGGSILWAVYCYIPLGYLSLSSWFSLGKRMVLRKEGCEIYFLNYRKFYRWDEFKTMEYTNFEKTYRFREVYKEGIYFSRKSLKKPEKMSLGTYAIFIRPFSLLYVNFKNGRPYMDCAVYEVEKEFFLNTLKEWGVTINGLP